MSKAPIERPSAGLRSALFDTLDDLRSGKTSSREAAAVAGIASQIVAISKLEIGYQRFVKSDAPSPGISGPPPIALG